MSDRPTRYLAPLALLAALVAVFVIVTRSTGGGDEGGGPAPTAEERREAQTGTTAQTDGQTGTTGTGTSTGSQRRTYRVRPGDTLAAIAERTGVTVEELIELNPDVDANSLTVGERIKLTE